MLKTDTCPICGSSRLRRVQATIAPFLRLRCGVDDENMRVDRCYCGECDYAFFDHRLDEGETARLYRAYRGEEYRALRERLEPGAASRESIFADRANDYHAARVRQAARLFSEWGVSPRSVLDYGGEPDGWLARTVFPAAATQAYDLSVDQPFPAGAGFDLVLCAHVLEHVSFPVPFLAGLRQFLAPGGLVYAEVPYDAVGPLTETIIEGHPLNQMHEHVSQFTPAALCRLMAAAGFEATHACAFRVEPYHRAIGVLGRSQRGKSTAPLPGAGEIPPLNPCDDILSPIRTPLVEKIDRVAEAWRSERKRVVLYPAGQCSVELLATTRLLDVVVALGDGDARLEGQERMGRRIYTPSSLLTVGADVILIASPRHESEIATALSPIAASGRELVRLSTLTA